MYIKRIIALSCIILSILLGILSAKPPEKPHWKNLKVMSKNTSEEEMDKVMESFNAQLGVVCIYCHELNQKDNPHKTNFESDEKPSKEIARKMLRMTLRLNRKYFGSYINNQMTGAKLIWCSTCHHGLLKPVTNQK
jgi:hypothetical protein